MIQSFPQPPIPKKQPQRVYIQPQVAGLQPQVAHFICSWAEGQPNFAASKNKNTMMLQAKSIGNKIATARKKANLSQAELAQHISISAQAVGKWERGESMPDITTLNRLAEILGVDLNYFSDSFPPIAIETAVTEDTSIESLTRHSPESPATDPKKKPNWDMSKSNLADSDFSGLKNLHEKFSSSNMQRCLFVGSDMSGLLLSSNNVDSCDFTDSDISHSRIQSSNLDKNIFKNCSLQGTEFLKCNIQGCDFTEADFTKATFRLSNFTKNNIVDAKWNTTSFREMQLRDIVFEGTLEDCYFEHCSFYNVKFNQATLVNTFFKNNDKLKRVEFIDCKADKLTYAFLKSNKANLTGITLIE